MMNGGNLRKKIFYEKQQKKIKSMHSRLRSDEKLLRIIYTKSTTNKRNVKFSSFRTFPIFKTCGFALWFTL